MTVGTWSWCGSVIWDGLRVRWADVKSHASLFLSAGSATRLFGVAILFPRTLLLVGMLQLSDSCIVCRNCRSRVLQGGSA